MIIAHQPTGNSSLAFSSRDDNEHINGLCSGGRSYGRYPITQHVIQAVNHQLCGGVDNSDGNNDYEINSSTDLTRWARQGILLKNVNQTRGNANQTHDTIGWRELSSLILYVLGKYVQHKRGDDGGSNKLLLLIWGNKIKTFVEQPLQVGGGKFLSLLDDKLQQMYEKKWSHSTNMFDFEHHLELYSVHPFTAMQNRQTTFVNNSHFSIARGFLKKEYNVRDFEW